MARKRARKATPETAAPPTPMETDASEELLPVHPSQLFHHMTNHAKIPNYVAKIESNEAPFTVEISCWNKKMTITFDDTVKKADATVKIENKNTI